MLGAGDNKMCPYPDHDKLIQEALAAVQEAASRLSPTDKIDLVPAESASRVDLQALEQKFQQLNEHCRKTIAEIRASLDRPPNKNRPG
jgi:hypothetical protein